MKVLYNTTQLDVQIIWSCVILGHHTGVDRNRQTRWKSTTGLETLNSATLKGPGARAGDKASQPKPADL